MFLYKYSRVTLQAKPSHSGKLVYNSMMLFNSIFIFFRTIVYFALLRFLSTPYISTPSLIWFDSDKNLLSSLLEYTLHIRVLLGFPSLYSQWHAAHLEYHVRCTACTLHGFFVMRKSRICPFQSCM